MKKRSFFLLEILMATAILSLLLFPLLTLLWSVQRGEGRELVKLEQEERVQGAFVELLEELYSGGYSASELAKGVSLEPPLPGAEGSLGIYDRETLEILYKLPGGEERRYLVHLSFLTPALPGGAEE